MTVSGFGPTRMSEVTVEDEQVPLFDPETLPAAFDAGREQLEIAGLGVSPICPICLDGVAVVRESLAELDSADVSIHVDPGSLSSRGTHQPPRRTQHDSLETTSK